MKSDFLKIPVFDVMILRKNVFCLPKTVVC